MQRNRHRGYEPAEIRYPASPLERIVNAASLRGTARPSSRGASVYLDHEPTGLVVRLSNHARHRHHRASYEHASADVTVLTLTQAQADDLAQADRFMLPGAVVIRRPGQRYDTTAKALRSALARAIWATR